MGRASANSITDVEKAAKLLNSQGKQVTPYRVQKALGGGSYGWIKGTLEQLGYGDSAGLPDGVDIDEDTAQLLRLIQPLINQLNLRASEDNDKLVSSHKVELENRDREAEELRNKLASVTEHLEAEQHAHTACRSELEASQTKVQELEHSESELQHSLKQCRDSLAQKEELVESLRENLTSARTAAATHLNDLKRELTTKISQIERDHRDTRFECQRLRDELLVLNRENARLIADTTSAKEETRRVESQLAEAQTELEATQSTTQELESRLSALDSELQAQHNEANKAAERERISATERDAANKVLLRVNAKLEDLESSSKLQSADKKRLRAILSLISI